MTDLEILHRYRQTRRGEDLQPLIERHLNWVHSCARRQLHGDDSLAGDVTQAVFLALMNKPPKLPNDGAIAGWLFTVARFISYRAIRSEKRRRRYEGQAAMNRNEIQFPGGDEESWRQLAPMLDKLVAKLPKQDQQGVILRFFQQQSYAQVGVALGISEEAARKRVIRAIEKLKQKMPAEKFGMTSVESLSAGLLLHATQPAPQAVSAAVIALASGAAPATTVLTMAKGAGTMFALMNAKLATVIVLLALFLPAAGIVLLDRAASPQVQAPATQPTTAPVANDVIQVHAVDGQGKPVSGAEVYAVQEIHSPYQSAASKGAFMTDSAGNVQFAGLPAVTAKMDARQVFFVRQRGQRSGLAIRSLGADYAPIAPGPVVVRMVDVSPLSGKVSVPPGFQVQKVAVRTLFVNLPSNGDLSDLWFTDFIGSLQGFWPDLFHADVAADGSFTLTDIPTLCSVAVAAEGPGLGQAQAMVARATQSSVQITMKPQAVIAGSLIYADSGQAAKGIKLQLRPKMMLPYTGAFEYQTDDRGQFRFEGLEEGIFNLMVEGIDGWCMPTRDQLRVEAGQTLDSINLKLQKGVVVTGHVLGTKDNKPVTQATIAALSPADDDGECIATGTTDANGQYTMRLPGGTVKLYIMSSGLGYDSPRDQGDRTITIDADGKVQGDLVFREKLDTSTSQPTGFATVQGRIVDNTGKPLAKLSIGDDRTEMWSGSPMPVSESNIALTDADGKFEIKIQAGIKHEIFICTPDYDGKSNSFTPKIDATVPIKMTAVATPILSYISGNVIDPQGKPLDSVQINSGSREPIAADAQGHFRAPQRSLDAAYLFISRDGYESRQFNGIPPGSDHLKFILYPTSQPHSSFKNAALPDSLPLLGQPAPKVDAEAWVRPLNPVAGKPILLMFDVSWDHGKTIARIAKLEELAAKMNAQAVVIYPPQAHESGVRNMLKDMQTSVAIGIDRFQVDSDYNVKGVTRIAFGAEGQTRIFLIAADGTVADDRVKMP